MFNILPNMEGVIAMDEKKCKKCQYFGYCYEDYCKVENERKPIIYWNNKNYIKANKNIALVSKTA